MNKFVLENGKIFQTVIDSISALIKEANFTFQKEFFGLNAIDPTTAAMVNLKMKKDGFKEYTPDKSQKISLDLIELNNLLKRCGANDKLTFSFLADKNKIKLEFEDEKKKRKRSFDLSTIEDEGILEKELDINKLDLPAKLTMNTDVIQTTIKDAKTIDSETLEIEVTKDLLKVNAVREMMNDLYTFELKLDEPETKDEISEVEITENSKSKYSLSYLEKIFKIGSVAKNVTLKFGSEQPAILDFDIENVDLFYVLAPQGEEEESDFEEEFDSEFEDDEEFEDI